MKKQACVAFGIWAVVFGGWSLFLEGCSSGSTGSNPGQAAEEAKLEQTADPVWTFCERMVACGYYPGGDAGPNEQYCEKQWALPWPGSGTCDRRQCVAALEAESCGFYDLAALASTPVPDACNGCK